MRADFLVVGGGIAGVSCAELLAKEAPTKSIILVTASPLVKAVADQSHLTKLLTTFNVVERNADEWGAQHGGVKVVRGEVSMVLPEEKIVKVTNSESGQEISYGKLCICTGASPKIISDNPNVLGIRDTESVAKLAERLASSKKVLVVGNGGIATELVYELGNIEVVWAIKDKSVNAAFVDPGAGEFFIQELGKNNRSSPLEGKPPTKRARYTVTSGGKMRGTALGPDWALGRLDVEEGRRNIKVEYGVEVTKVYSDENNKFPVIAELSNGKLVGCDFIVSATGVVPGGEEFRSVMEVDKEGGIVVDDNMRTSVSDIYAAGDVCSAGWDHARHWFQMRLWSQARLMGYQAGRAMVDHSNGEDRVEQDFGFEMFAHVTKFFGFKVVLLGLFNGQKLDTRDYEVLLRVTPGMEFVKTVMVEGRMQGALLIGETDLEETFENLILNQLDLSSYGEDLLDPGVDIEDYFD